MSPRRSWLIVSLACGALAGAPSPTSAEVSGGSVVGLGFGPPAVLGGPLATIYTAEGVSGRLRMGGRFGHLGFELAGTIAALHGGAIERPSLMLATPSLTYYPWDHPWAQLAVRGGIGVGGIVGDQRGPAPPCHDEPPCPGPTVETVSDAAVGLELGATAQLHLGRRHGGRAVLSVDVGLTMVRVQHAERVVSGRVVMVTFGVAHGMAF